jgi:hypothetical protein
MSAAERPTRWGGDAGARRLLAVVREACASAEDLPTGLAAGLRVTLDTFVAEPELAYELTVAPWLESDGRALDAQRVWMARFGDLLSDAVAGDPRIASSRLPFLAGYVIGDVRFQIGRLVLNHEAADLPRLLPGLLEGVLAYYFEPGEPRALTKAALAGH